MKMLHKFTLGGTSNAAGICLSGEEHVDDIVFEHRRFVQKAIHLLEIDYLDRDLFAQNHV